MVSDISKNTSGEKLKGKFHSVEEGISKEYISLTGSPTTGLVAVITAL